MIFAAALPHFPIPRIPLRHQTFDGINGIHLPRPKTLIIPRVLAYRNRHEVDDHIHTSQRLCCTSLKISLFVKHVVERQEHLLLHKTYLAQASSSTATFLTCLPTLETAAITVPHKIAGYPIPAVHLASSATDCSASATNAAFSNRSAGGYPHTASSGKITRLAAISPARAAYSKNFFRIPGKIAYRWVELGQRYLHPLSLTLRTQSRSIPHPPFAPGFSDPSSGSSSQHKQCQEKCNCRRTDPAAPQPATDQ